MANAPVRLRIASRESIGTDPTEPDAERKCDASADYHLNDEWSWRACRSTGYAARRL
jgi:hypothetical protein